MQQNRKAGEKIFASMMNAATIQSRQIQKLSGFNQFTIAMPTEGAIPARVVRDEHEISRLMSDSPPLGLCKQGPQV